MRVAILGDGLLGRTLLDYFAATEKASLDDGYAVMLGHKDIEVTDPDSIRRALEPHRPDVAINTVAFHKLQGCEDDPMLARLVNTDGARNVASVLPTVYVSTDYVFNDGGPHDEDLPGEDPRSVYGKTKLGGELATLEHGGIVARVSALFGHHRSHKGPSFPELVASSFDALRVPADQRFSPTYAPDAAARIADIALALGFHASTCVPLGELDREQRPQGIYHAANAGSTSWAEFAAQIVEVLPWQRHVEAIRAHDRLRPTNSSLRSTRLPPLRHWRLALDEWAEVRRKELYVSPLRSE